MSIEKDNNNILENGGDGKKPHANSRKNNKKHIFIMLENLSRTDINVQESRNMAEKFYCNDDKNSTRHKYSDITRYVYDNYKQGKVGNITRNIEVMVRNLREDDLLRAKLIKLQDHIDLEILRTDHMEMVESNIKDIDRRIQATNKQIQQTKREIKNTKNEIQDSKKQYIVILGIFASIVLAFVAGLSFSSSVLANIDKASIYRLIFVMAFIALFVGNMLFALLGFLQDMSSRDDTAKSKLTNLNTICLTIMLVDGLIWLFQALCKT